MAVAAIIESPNPMLCCRRRLTAPRDRVCKGQKFGISKEFLRHRHPDCSPIFWMISSRFIEQD